MAERKLRGMNISKAEGGFTVSHDYEPEKDKSGSPTWSGSEPPHVMTSKKALMAHVEQHFENDPAEPDADDKPVRSRKDFVKAYGKKK